MMNINKSFKHDFSLIANLGASFEDHYTRGVDIGGKLAINEKSCLKLLLMFIIKSA